MASIRDIDVSLSSIAMPSPPHTAASASSSSSPSTVHNDASQLSSLQESSPKFQLIKEIYQRTLSWHAMSSNDCIVQPQQWSSQMTHRVTHLTSSSSVSYETESSGNEQHESHGSKDKYLIGAFLRENKCVSLLRGCDGQILLTQPLPFSLQPNGASCDDWSHNSLFIFFFHLLISWDIFFS